MSEESSGVPSRRPTEGVVVKQEGAPPAPPPSSSPSLDSRGHRGGSRRSSKSMTRSRSRSRSPSSSGGRGRTRRHEDKRSGHRSKRRRRGSSSSESSSSSGSTSSSSSSSSSPPRTGDDPMSDAEYHRRRKYDRDLKHRKQREKDRREEREKKKERERRRGRHGREAAAEKRAAPRASGWDLARPEGGGPAQNSRLQTAIVQAIQQQQKISSQEAVQAATKAREDAAASRIYVGSLPYDVNDLDLLQLFGRFGQVRSLSVSRETPSGRCKGFCFVDFVAPEAAVLALQHGQNLSLAGRALKVARPHFNTAPQMHQLALPQATGQNFGMNAESLQQAQAQVQVQAAAIAAAVASGTPLPQGQALAPAPGGAAPSNRVYVGNIPWDVNEAELLSVFKAFGSVTSISLMTNPDTGKHKGFAFLEYESPQMAFDAIERMNGTLFAGRQLRVWHANTAGASAALLAQQQQQQQQQRAPVIQSGPVDMGNMVRSISQMISDQKKSQLSEEPLSKEDNISITPTQRLQLMQLLARSGGPVPAAQQEEGSPSLTTSSQLQRAIIAAAEADKAQPSRVLVLRNMATIEEVDDHLQKDVEAECSRLGIVERVVVHVQPPSDTAVVKVFVVFKSMTDAVAAHPLLDKRFFAGRQITADFYDEQQFNKSNLSL
eukprot:m51a1_g3295 hypothetical protein (661) ;mRNA; f:284820-287338